MLGKILLIASLTLAVQSASVQLKETAQCNVCTTALTELKEISKDQDFLFLAKTYICNIVSIENCDDKMTKELDMLSKEMEVIDPTTKCTSIGACNYKISQIGESIPCEFCEFLGNEIKSVMSNDTIEEICDTGIYLCSKVLPFLVNDCEAVIKYFGHYYLEHLFAQFDVKEICIEAGLCSDDVRHMIEASELFQAIRRGVQENDKCKACKDGFKEIQMIISSPETLDLLHLAVKEICDLLQSPMCEILADTALDTVIKKIITMMDPNTICNDIGACDKPEEIFNGFIDDRVFTPECENCNAVEISEAVSNVGDTCSICTLVADELLTGLKNEEMDKLIKEGIEEICSILPISNCAETLDGYVDTIIGLIKNMDGKSLCSLIGMCSSYKVEEVVHVEDLGDVCSECTLIADEILVALKNPMIDGLIKEGIEEICSIIPVSNCKSMVDSYIDMLINLIKKTDGKGLCSMIGMCSSVVDEVALPEDVDDLCLECVTVMDDTLNKMRNYEVVWSVSVKVAIEELCSHSSVSNCRDVWNGYIDIVIEWINKVDGKQICSSMALCPINATVSQSRTDVGSDVVDGDDICNECQYYFDYILDILNTDEELIKMAIEDICAQSSVSNCKEVWNGYIDKMVAWMNKMDGKKFCSLLALCPMDTNVPKYLQDGGPLCPECKTVVNIILKELLIPANWALIEFSLDEACLVLPIPNCKSTIHTILAKIKDYIKSLNSTTICTDIGLCSKSCNKANDINELFANVGDMCSECSMVAQEVISLLTNPMVDSAVKGGLETVCSIIPIPDCTNLVDKYFDMVIGMIKNMDGKTLCSYIGLC